MAFREVKVSVNGFCPTCKKSTVCSKLKEKLLNPGAGAGVRLHVLLCDICKTEFVTPNDPLLYDADATRLKVEIEVLLNSMWQKVQRFKLH